VGNRIERIKGVLKRGVWQFDPTDSEFTKDPIELDNGVKIDDISAI
jgi:hypothetical protein